MSDYRLYQLDPDTGHITSAENFQAADDGAAILIAQRRGHKVAVELWSGPRKVARLDPPPAGAAWQPQPLGEPAPS